MFDNVSKMSKLEEVSYEMLVFLHPRVLSRVSGFPVASPCLWGKPQNLSFSKVSKQLVMAGGCGASCQGAKRLPRSLMLSLTLTQCLSLFLEVGDLDWPNNLAVWCL